MYQKVDNKKLITECANNNRKAQELLYQNYFDAMFAIGSKYSTDEDKIIEWVNNGFLKVFKKIHTVENPESLPGWIKSVVYRSILDGIRAEKKYNAAMFFNIDEEFQRMQNTGSNYDYEVILNHVELLPEATKKVFKLFVIEGFSHRAIAEKIGISEGTSKWHLNNAKTKLQQILVKNNIFAVG